PAAAGEIGCEHPGPLEQFLGLEEIDDVDAVALTEDEAAHLWIPAARLVAEVNAGLQQLLDSDLSHCCCSLVCGCHCNPAAGTREPRWSRQGAVRAAGVGENISLESLRKFANCDTFCG